MTFQYNIPSKFVSDRKPHHFIGIDYDVDDDGKVDFVYTEIHNGLPRLITDWVCMEREIQELCEKKAHSETNRLDYYEACQALKNYINY